MTRTIIAAALLAGTIATTAGAQAGTPAAGDPGRFEWKGEVPAGAWIVVRNMNGSISVDGGSGRAASIVGTKRVENGGDPSIVRFVSKPLANGGILVCALWGEAATCDEDSYHGNDDGNRHGRRRNVAVKFDVTLPQGTNVRLSTINGELSVQGATAAVAANTVNGSIRASTSGGPVEARTVNGDVRARMGNVGTSDLSFTTVNGSITVDLPASLNADVELRTVNGGFQTDFPMTMSGRITPRRLSGKIGNGGHEVRATTVNGSIELRKSS